MNMNDLKKRLGEWIQGTEVGVKNLKACASYIHKSWEEVKECMLENVPESSRVKERYDGISTSLNVMLTDLDKMNRVLEGGYEMGNDGTIGLDELVEDFLRGEAARAETRNVNGMPKTVSQMHVQGDDASDMVGLEIIEDVGFSLDIFGDEAKKQFLRLRVEKHVAEYLRMEKRYCNSEPESDELKARVEQLMVGTMSKKLDCAILKYVFDEAREPSQVLIATDTLSLRREEILPLSLKRSATNKVVDVFIEMLTVEERKVRGNGAKFWWIPTYITRPLQDETYVMNNRSYWSKWIGNLYDVSKIYVPAKLKEIWFVAIICVEVSIVEVVCSVKEMELRECLAMVHDVLEVLDAVLMDDIVEFKPIGWRFIDFEVYQRQVAVEIDRGGLFVMNVMHYGVQGRVVDNQPAVEDALMTVALQILKAEVNKARFEVASEAIAFDNNFDREM